MTLHLAVENHLATITVDRPQKLNALDLNSYTQLGQFLQTISTSSDIRGLVICSSSRRTFSAGADINDNQGLDPVEAAERAS